MFYKTVRQYSDTDISDSKQKQLNTPLKAGPSRDHEHYFEFLYDLLTKQKIELVTIQSIIKKEPYKKLSHEQEGSVDLAAANILHFLRQLHQLFDQNQQRTHQAMQLVEHIWQIKDRVEKEHGDVFII